MTDLVVAGGRPLQGTVRVPGDKSISHRALLLSLLADGESTVKGLSLGADVLGTLRAVRQLGAEVDGDPASTLRIRGGRLTEAPHVIDVGNSGTTLRLLAGVTAGLDALTVLEGDASIARRPMDRIVEPLRAMGARIDGREGGRLAPLTIRGGGLRGIDYTLPVPSAQVKGAILLAGLGATGETVVRESAATRIHTEEMLGEAGVQLDVADGVVRLTPSPVRPHAWVVPGDPSQAAFWVVAACTVPDSDVTVESLYLGPGRTGFLEVLERMGARLEVDGDRGVVRARHGGLHGTEVTPDEIPGLIDEIPVLAVAAAAAEGETRFDGVGELALKESDRLRTVRELVGAFGGRAEAGTDRLVIRGGGHRAGSTSSEGDHRIGMAAAVAAAGAEGSSTIERWESVTTSYPGFADELERLQASGGH